MAKLIYSEEVKRNLEESGNVDFDVMEKTAPNVTAKGMFKEISGLDDEMIAMTNKAESNLGFMILQFDFEEDTVTILDNENTTES